ncbi:hypothetical protein CAPTEDRAFT_169274 [Capitella teleta]|uniref:I/LWEQ domain-containing protein n=1 Tax=Capitella teleta TaxID=283909 RepID=R7T827_CAPTE|nr:hypothetical protein CAPTEDRAFT_169274 [Capitella teleta]|eukprot:ELT89608.1 hypothetical protein CAPTEDRAFT_169274 [Capitella teleta]
MSSGHIKDVVLSCNQSINQMQLVAELLLLSSDLRPVRSEALTGFHDSFPNCKELVMTRTRGLFVIAGRLHELLYCISTARWFDVNRCVHEMCELVISLTETCAHAAYLLALTYPNCYPAEPGIVDLYTAKRTAIDIGICAQHLKQASREQLTPPILVQICSTVNKNLGQLTETCKTASSRAVLMQDQEQFKMCVKSSTTSGGCFLTSIKRFKQQPTEQHRTRCVSFCDSLAAVVSASVNYASEDQFIGHPARISSEAFQSKMAVLGACMSIVSSCIQLCKVVKELAYNISNQAQMDRIAMCIQAISRASSQLADAFLQHQHQAAGDDNAIANGYNS